MLKKYIQCISKGDGQEVKIVCDVKPKDAKGHYMVSDLASLFYQEMDHEIEIGILPIQLLTSSLVDDKKLEMTLTKSTQAERGTFIKTFMSTQSFAESYVAYKFEKYLKKFV